MRGLLQMDPDVYARLKQNVSLLYLIAKYDLSSKKHTKNS